jgi:nucleotide-binding universal stress UspA family protein
MPGPSEPTEPAETASGAAPQSDPHPSSLPRFRQFLLAVRTTESDHRVWAVVADLVHGGSRGLVCHVILRPTSAAANEIDGSAVNGDEVAINRALRNCLVDRLGGTAREIPIRILHGDPGQRICEYARFSGSDLIVLGLRAHSSLGRWVRGSVGTYVAANSPCSVLLVSD